MQTEKYLYWLNKSGKEGEKRLNTKYKNELPAEIKITNPSAIIIMVRSSNLSDNQRTPPSKIILDTIFEGGVQKITSATLSNTESTTLFYRTFLTA